MKRFITKKKIKIRRYHLLYILAISSIILIIIINIFLKYSLKKVNQEKFLKLIINNSYGNILYTNSILNNKINFFHHNIYGFNIEENTKAISKENNISELIIDTKPLIYIYNTFQTDKYKKNYYNSYNVNSVVTHASLILKEYLKYYKINSIVETESVAKILKENNISYNLSYRGSRILLEKAKNNNNSLEYFIDLGLSDDEYNITTTKINNKSYAKVLFIIGTDNTNYSENQKLAQSLNEKLEKINKDLTRGISLRGGTGYHGVYNQDFSNNAILIYVGSKENTIDEVNRTLKILAQILAEHIKEAK